jgi:capsular exopolysaccharide synthesis family protein
MSAHGEPATRGADWLTPQTEQQTLPRYLTTLRERGWLVVLCTLVCALAAIAYVAVADKVYKASADLLVTPVPSGDDTTVGLGLIRESNDPSRDVSTIARYIESVPVAARVKRELGRPETPTELLRSITAEPVAQSSVVSVTAEDGTPEDAARLANAFATETVRLRTAQLREQLERTVPALRARLNQLPPEERAEASGEAIAGRLAELERLRTVPDPTVRVSTPATAPEQQAAPRPVLSVVAGIAGGLLLGLGAAFGLQALDPRLRREGQLRELYRLPILARIPIEPRDKRKGAIAPEKLSAGTFEAYRTLRASLAAARSTEFRAGSVLVTGSSPGEGKTTSAINLAHALVAAGNKVILIEADVHRPQIGNTLGIRPRFGLASVLIRQVALEDALITTEEYGPDLQLLLVDRPGLATADRLSLPTARQLVADAEQLADYVVIDSPPLTEVIDALPLAQEVAQVLLVARLGRTKLRKLTELGEILAQNGVRPAGVALIGVERSKSGYYYTVDSPSAGRETTRSAS